jgi:hypothetical protein
MSIQTVEISLPESIIKVIEIRQGPAGPGGGNSVTSATTSDGTADLDLLNVDTVTATVSDTLTANHIHGNLAGNVYAHVRAGETLTKGNPVYVSGSHGSGSTLIPIVSKADASNAAKMPAIGIMDADLANNATGHMVIVGTITELNTAGYTVNAELYVATGGGLTATPPTARAQPVARVERVNANNGAVIVKVNGLSASDATGNTLVRRTVNGDASFNFVFLDTVYATDVAADYVVANEYVETKDLTVANAATFNATTYTYGANAASAHRIALGAGTTGAALFGAADAAAARTTLELGAFSTNGSITGTGALTFNGTSVVLQTGGTTRATVASVGIDIANGHYLRTFGAPDATANFRFGANSALDGLAHVVRNSDSFKLLQFGSVALNFMGGYDLIGRPSGIALGGQITGESIRLASVTGNITTIGTIATTSATASTSTTTGALVVSGGVGVAGNINAGGTLSVTGVGRVSRLGVGAAAAANPLNVGTPSAELLTIASNFGVSVSQASGFSYLAENTNPSGSSAGAFVGLYSNDGSAMASGDRLGGFFFGGSSSSSALRNACIIQGFAETAWVDGSNYGAGIAFETTANGGTTRSEKMRLSNDGNLTVTGAVKTGGYTFATLPTPTQGMRTFITDGAALPIYMANAAGGGSTVTPVFYNGTNWINA